MRSPAQQPLHISSTDNREGSDSWNSSNNDPADDLDLEWKPEHVFLLTRFSMLFPFTYSLPASVPFHLQTCSTKLPLM
ncbi:hypothetical protein BJV78DRAFT_1201035 [Lactifluus subvellereus]|nr:hypothetical protein BJV78DRAFT_1201035 [Lactifluus subvellereus]